jgi:uncharacterized protein (TIGR03086 family)
MSEELTYVLDSMEKLIANTREDQMANPTPCDKWVVRDLINHFVGGGHMFATLYRGEPMPDMDGPVPDMLGSDPAAAARAARADFDAALAEPGVMERIVHLPIGSVPAPVGLNLATFDVLVHCWDLATATGQAFDPPVEIVAIAQGYARQILQPEARDGDTFKAEETPSSGASALARLAAFTGRVV